MKVDEAVRRFDVAIEAGAATVLVGAGLSRGASYPDWGQLLDGYHKEFELGPEFSDLPMLAQYVVNRDGNRERLIRHVCEQIGAGERHWPQRSKGTQTSCQLRCLC